VPVAGKEGEEQEMNVLALDLGTHTGWAIRRNGVVVSGTWHFTPGRYEGGGMRFLRFRKQVGEALELAGIEAVYFEEVRRHLGTDAAHVYGGMLGVLTSLLEERSIPYQGVPVGTLKKWGTGKGNADKEKMIAAARERFPLDVIEDDNQADALIVLAWAAEEAGAK
jgi:Holliday junction resolvasome RuvABC endonuclease subunit